MSWQGFKSFIIGAFSENGSPSSSRLLSAWLSVSSMALIWFCVRHAMTLQDPGKVITWVGGLPSIIMALAAFAVSPYTVAKLGQTLSSFKDKLNQPQG
jgi:hypothetical protein